jgi:tetratricopeptide (TPR) repeat protein
MNARTLLAGAAVAVLLPAGSAFAQYGTVRGKVVDDKGAPVAEAQILLEGQGEVAGKKVTIKTNKKGEFAQVGLPRGNYKATVSKDGLQAVSLGVSVSTGDTAELGEIKLPALSGNAARASGNAEMQKAVELANAKDYDAAAEAFKTFLEKNPAHAIAHYNLGWVYAQKKDWANAEASLRKAVELDPSMPQPYGLLAVTLQQVGKGQEGTDLLVKAAAANPDNADLQFAVGKALFDTGKSAEAHAAFEKTLALVPEHVEAQYFIGMTNLQQGKIPEAVKHLQKYVATAGANEQYVAIAKGVLSDPSIKAAATTK